MNLCVNCVHFRALGQQCDHELNTDPVMGTTGYESAHCMRSATGKCGPEGRFYEVDTQRFTSTPSGEKRSPTQSPTTGELT